MYLDNAATTKPVDSIVEAIRPYIEEEWYNPSAIYRKGLNVRKKIESVRADIAQEINVKSDEIYFTSGATESNNWAIRGFVDKCRLDGKIPMVIVSDIEHNSILDCVKHLPDCGYYVSVPVDKEGYLKMETLKSILYTYQDRCSMLVSISMANNEIGTIQDIAKIAEMVHSHGGILHTDITQCFGHIHINNNVIKADMMSASAQKLGGLKGTGFLYKKDSVKIQPLIYGSQEQEQRGGTENVIGIVAFGEAVKQINYRKRNQIRDLRTYMISELIHKFDCVINGAWNNGFLFFKGRLPNNINVTFPQNITGEALIYLLETDDIYISAGSACNSYSIKPSHVLRAIGLSDDEISRTVRITLPDNIDREQIDKVIDKIDKQITLLTS